MAATAFWRRARYHVAVLRAGRPLNRIDQPLRRIWGFVVYVIGQKRLLQDPVPGLMHAFIFWGFVALLVTTGNYITNGLVETVLAWPLGGVLWMLAVGLANLFIGLVLVGVVLLARPPHRAAPDPPGPVARRVRDPGPDPGGGHHAS